MMQRETFIIRFIEKYLISIWKKENFLGHKYIDNDLKFYKNEINRLNVTWI